MAYRSAPKRRSSIPSSYLRERLATYPGLTAVRLWRGSRSAASPAATASCAIARAIFAPSAPPDSSTPDAASEQAQIDFAQFNVEFADQPGVKRIVWLFSMVLGCNGLIQALCRPPGPAKRPALPYRRPRGDRRRTREICTTA